MSDSTRTRDYLGQAAPWLRFLTILGYIGVGLALAAAVVLIVAGILTPRESQMVQLIATAAAVLLVLAPFVFPLILLGRLAKGSRQYKRNGEESDLESVAKNVKGLAQYYGIFSIVVLSIYLLLGILFILAATRLISFL